LNLASINQLLQSVFNQLLPIRSQSQSQSQSQSAEPPQLSNVRKAELFTKLTPIFEINNIDFQKYSENEIDEILPFLKLLSQLSFCVSKLNPIDATLLNKTWKTTTRICCQGGITVKNTIKQNRIIVVDILDHIEEKISQQIDEIISLVNSMAAFKSSTPLIKSLQFYLIHAFAFIKHYPEEFVNLCVKYFRYT